MKKRIACRGKIKHRKKEQAYYALRKLKKKGFFACVYKCRKCGFYHVGKPSYTDDPKEFWFNIHNRMELEKLNKIDNVFKFCIEDKRH